MTWAPLLDAASRREALRKAYQIGGALRGVVPRRGAPSLPPVLDGSLVSGSAGLAVANLFLHEAFPSEDFLSEADRHLQLAGEALATVEMSPALFTGFTGVGWAFSFMEQWCPRDARDCSEDACEELDSALMRVLEDGPWRGHLDVAWGLAGYGVYLLERVRRASALRCLERVVEHLAAAAEEHAEGTAWFTPATLMPDEMRARVPAGCYNLGLTHGIPGIIGVLAACEACGVATGKTSKLLDPAVAWLEAQALPDLRFPSVITTDAPRRATRSAWCYGAAGIALALYCAGQRAVRPRWQRLALRIGQASAVQSVGSNDVTEIGLCHGSAGLAHIFNRMHQYSGDAACAHASRYWLERTMASLPECLVLGSASYDDAGILTGLAGIALALLGLSTEQAPAWDRCLLGSGGGE